MHDPIPIRPAQPADAERAAVLLYSAYTHTQVPSPLPEAHESRFIEHLQYFFREAGNRFSYQNIQVAEQNSEVVGLVLSFGGEMRYGSTLLLESGSNGRRRTMNGMLTRWLC
jgi:hypothetical protein